MNRVPRYIGLRPKVSESGPAKGAPAPKPTRKRTVASDSVSSLTWSSRAAWGMTGASMEEPKPAMKATEAVRALVEIFFQS
jgi:hypothetical protein